MNHGFIKLVLSISGAVAALIVFVIASSIANKPLTIIAAAHLSFLSTMMILGSYAKTND